MEWLTGNVLWIVLGALFVWMHLKEPARRRHADAHGPRV